MSRAADGCGDLLRDLGAGEDFSGGELAGFPVMPAPVMQSLR
jgi:hypothetical protein